MAKVSSVASSWKVVTRQVPLASPDSDYLQARIRDSGGLRELWDLFVWQRGEVGQER